MSTTIGADAPRSTDLAPRRTPPPRATTGDRQVTLGRVLRSEWIKFRTLRSSWLLIAAAYAAMIGIGAIVGYNTGNNWAGSDAEDLVPSGGLQGFLMAQLLIGVLGVLFVTGDYATGMIRATLTAVPRRLPVLVAKTLVYGTLTLVAMVPAVLAGWFTAQAFLVTYGHGTSLFDPGVPRVVFGTALYLTLVGLLGSAIGWLLRSTAGGISTYVGLLLVLPLLTGLLPGSLGTTLTTYLPGTAGESFITSVHLPDTLTPWTGLGVLALWVAAALVAAAVQLRRRDA